MPPKECTILVFIHLIIFTMLNNSSLQKWDRLEKKSLDNQFINGIISGMNCSPFEAKAILDTVHKVYGDFFETSETLAPGKAKFIVISAEDSPAKSLKDAKKVNVVLTINDDGEDLGIKQKDGCSGLRQHRLQRICNEAFMQGGLLTVEDIANRIFCCGERTVVRDLQELKKQEVFVPLRSTIKDMGRTLSHRTLIVNKWVKGHEYSEIARETNHSVSAISNYIQKFKQAVALMKDGYDVHTIAFLVKISNRLAEEYIDIYAHSEIVPSRKEELDNLLKKRMSN
jgi:AAA+ ATPase superfamily predicted ATPase